MLRSEALMPAILKTRGAATELQIPLVDAEPVIESPAVAGLAVAEPQKSPESLSAVVNGAAALALTSVGPLTAAVPLVAADVAIPKPTDYQQYQFPTVEDILEGEPADFKMPADDIHRSFHPAPSPTQPQMLTPDELPETSDSQPSELQEKTSVETRDKVKDEAKVVAPVVAASAVVVAAPVSAVALAPVSAVVPVVAVDRALATQVEKAAASAKQWQRRAAATVDFCVACHDQRIAKVCLQCHPRDRKDRM